ncbi:Stf0 family sulfotransferase [Pseudomaricurvus sp. HS19]|uniref:Stf0 family sulfotransferase n=1 Tax=Pseudomaricurvus sp. HS19 TaxID=2692626 RepID=UPI001369AAF4|nr:Stf0 family sulfotransferase [Pseudomaricurvus sp. HS19]MYM63691.1 hypothetical protein [Pseudomaricurvus sp. HS19]
MIDSNDILITDKRINTAIAKIPESDFIDVRYDTGNVNELKGIFVLLSTPRSGSTMICDLLYKSGFCLSHEYFQPYDYLPLLARRWDCIKDGVLDKSHFIEQLARHRTLESGWLGINLHGHHLPLFSKLKNHLPRAESVYVRVRRRNVIAQAVSYEIASQSGRWSSEFKSESAPVYSFQNIKNKLQRLEYQNLLTDSFLSSENLDVIELIYEDFVQDPASALRRVLPETFHQNLAINPSLKQQSSELNKDWISRFTREFFDTEGEGHAPEKKHDNDKHLLNRLLRKLTLFKG